MKYPEVPILISMMEGKYREGDVSAYTNWPEGPLHFGNIYFYFENNFACPIIYLRVGYESQRERGVFFTV